MSDKIKVRLVGNKLFTDNDNATGKKKMAVALFILFAFIIFQDKQLKTKHILDKAIVEDCYVVRSKGTYYYMEYSFIAKETKYKGKESLGTVYFDLSDLYKRFVGKTIPVVYNSDFPSNNNLLLREKDYKDFRVTQPDSLKWIDKYLNRQ